MISTMNSQTLQLRDLTGAVNGLVSYVRDEVFASEDRAKLNSVAADVSTILSILKAQQQPPAPPAASSPPVLVSSIPLHLSWSPQWKLHQQLHLPRGRNLHLLGILKILQLLSDLLKESEEQQQTASPSSSKGEQSTAVKMEPMSSMIIEEFEEDIPVAEEELVRKRKGKSIAVSPPKVEGSIVADVPGQDIREIVESGFDLETVERAGIDLQEVTEARKVALEFELKKKSDKGKRKEDRNESLRSQYFTLIRNRVDADTIVSATITCPSRGSELNAFITRKRSGHVSHIKNIQDQSLGVTEWVEM